MYCSYSICFRQEAGYCCLQILRCDFGNVNAFSIDGMGTIDNAANLDTNCDSDFLGISGMLQTVYCFN